MKITIISYDNWGFNSHIANVLAQQGHLVNHIDIYSFRYKYPDFSFRIKNFFLKIFFGENLKHIYYGNKILKILKNQAKQDLILTIKGDFINTKSLIDFKKFSTKSIAFFNDSINRYPNIKNVIPHFDEVFSFEKKDCKKYNLTFKTNFIYNKLIEDASNLKYDLFNISSTDKRTKTILKIALAVKKIGINYKIIIFDGKNKLKKYDFIEIIEKPLSLENVNQFITESKVLLDIHRTKQDGLSFRIFESLGKEKKIITTNADIKHYDFYNSNNILVIDTNKVVIPSDFFENSYQPIPKEILEKYLLENWVNEFINS